RVEIEKVARAAEGLRERVDQVGARIREAEAERLCLDADIEKVTRAPDPLAERAEVAAQHERLEREVEAARRARQAAETRLAAAPARAQAERNTAAEAARRAQDARAQAHQAAREAGFPDERTAEAAALPEAEIARLTSETSHYRRELHAAAQ